MTSPRLEILAYEQTSLGPLCLRRRSTPSDPSQRVTEITLNHEFLMSSLHTDSERELAKIAIAGVASARLKVLVGGLGLGFTARAALAEPRVVEVEVVEFLPQVIDWLQAGLLPHSDELSADLRLSVTAGDIYQRLLASPAGKTFDAILIDVDHSPDDPLSETSARFYTADGIAAATAHLNVGGTLALWSYAEHTPLLATMQQANELEEVQAHAVSYFNRHVHEEFTDWLYVARRRH